MAICSSNCAPDLPVSYSGGCSIIRRPGGIKYSTFVKCDYTFTDISDVEEWAAAITGAVYLTTASLLGVNPGRCLALEDSIHGVLAAKAAGMRCIAVPDASSEAPGGEARLGSRLVDADLVLPSLAELDEAAWTRLAGLEG